MSNTNRRREVDAKEKWGGQTPLLYAARENCMACVDMLVDVFVEREIGDQTLQAGVLHHFSLPHPGGV